MAILAYILLLLAVFRDQLFVYCIAELSWWLFGYSFI
jgi:hypothetical protein